MKSLKLFFIFLVFFAVLGSAHSFIVGVSGPPDLCIKPDRTWIIPVNCQSGSEYYEFFEVFVAGKYTEAAFLSAENRSYIFFPNSKQNIPVYVNTTSVEEGTYEFTFAFCSKPPEKQEGMGIGVCIKAPIHVNVSENCPELPEPVKTDAESYSNSVFFPLLRTKSFRTSFNYSVLGLILLLVLYLLFKNFVLKKVKK